MSEYLLYTGRVILIAIAVVIFSCALWLWITLEIEERKNKDKSPMLEDDPPLTKWDDSNKPK